MLKHLNIKIGQIFYCVRNQRKLEVTRLDQTGVYLCCFNGSCSEIRHVWHGISEADFLSRYANTYADAFQKNVLSEEMKVKRLREFFESSVLTDRWKDDEQSRN